MSYFVVAVFCHFGFWAVPETYNLIYADVMFDIYAAVTSRSLLNFLCAKCPLPLNFNFDQWNLLAHTYADKETIVFLQYSFPASYQSPIPTPLGKKITLLPLSTTSDIKKYIDTEVRDGAMLGPFSQPPFILWCQTTPLLTWPQKGL